MDRVIQITANSLQRRRPRAQRIGLIVVEHVAHRQRNLVQIILDPKQLQ